jgi:predicted TIM-barrel fold metal-dependent hydrolase
MYRRGKLFGVDLTDLRLVDHHVHGPAGAGLSRAGFEQAITESDRPVPGWMSTFDSQVGFAIRRWCAPVLGLEPFAAPGDYLARRRELGAAEVNRRFLRAAGVSHYLVETGWSADQLLDPAEVAEVSGARAYEVVRLEAVAEELAVSGVDAAGFASRYATALAERSRHAVGLKTVVAYRSGLDFDPRPPVADEVAAAAGRWLASGSSRLDDPVLSRHIIWAAVELGLPLQFHVGFGDPDVRLHRSDPLLLTDFLELVEPRGVPVLLLHCYPYHRQAGFLAHSFPHVYFDVGLAVNYTGTQAPQVIAESLELAPFAKVLYSSDAWGPAELHYLGAVLWRRSMERILDGTGWPAAEALRIATLIGRDNALRVYGLDR